MTPRIRSLVAAEPLVPPQFRAASAPFIFREFVETLQRLHDAPAKLTPGKRGSEKSAKKSARAKPKARRARKTHR
jgi:hypothetical protein